MTFYNDFANFPYPFDSIEPEDLRQNNNYRILNKYYLNNRIHFAWLLKEINIFIGRHDKAKDFAEIGLTEALKNAGRMFNQFKSKSQQKETEKYIEINRQLFKL